MKLRFALAGLLVMAGLALVAAQTPAPKDPELIDIQGYQKLLQQYKGKPLLVTFWATWCEPCRTELPTIQAAYTKVRASAAGPGPGLEVLGVAVESDPAIVISFQKEFSLAYPLLPDEAGQVKNLYRVGPIPTSFFIDRQGIIRAIQIGILADSDLTEKLKLIP